MICNVKNCNKEAKNLVKIGIYIDFQLCDEHFSSFIESHKEESFRSYMLKELDRLKGGLRGSRENKLEKEDQEDWKKRMRKFKGKKHLPPKPEPTTASKRRREIMDKLKDLWESRESE